MSASDFKNAIFPTSPKFGVVISRDEQIISVGIDGKIRQFSNHSNFQVGDKVIVENENVRAAFKNPVRVFEV